jgi:hypothetical protein
MSSSSLQDVSDFTLAQQVAITLASAFSGTLSILGSSCIIWMLLQNKRKKLKSVKYRILFALCLSDLINSLVFVFWSLPIPKGTPGVWGALGNKASCDAQGVLIQFGNIGSFYNAALALYFYKSLCYSMNDEQIAKRYEKWIHIVSLLWPVGTGIAAWQQDLYSVNVLGCWIAPEPLRCNRRDGVDCIRGEDAYTFVWLYAGIPSILLLSYITYTMWMIYMKVKEVSRKAEKWSIGMVGASYTASPSRMEAMQSLASNINDGSLHTCSQTLGAASTERGSIARSDNQGSSRHAERTKEAAWQAFLYVIAYVVTHSWSFIAVFIEQSGGTAPFFVVCMENLTWPLQGFANVFIFLRPRIISIQKSSPKMRYFTAAYHSVFLYDEVHRRSLKWTKSRPTAVSEPSSGTNNTSDSLGKSTGKASEAINTPATQAGMNESRHDKEERLQPVIHEESLSHHDADEEPTIADVALFAQSAEPKRASMEKDVPFDEELDILDDSN